MEETKLIIKVSDVLQYLKDGLTREKIQEKYGISKTDLKLLFQHPKLKGKKTHKKLSFEILDDTEENFEIKAKKIEADIKGEPAMKTSIESVDTQKSVWE